MERFPRLKVKPPKITDVVDIESEIEHLCMESLRAIFEHDKRFLYLRDEPERSALEITSEFPKQDVPAKKPHIVVSSIAFSVDNNNSYFQNFDRTLFSEYNGINNYEIGMSYTLPIGFSMRLTAIGNKSVARNLSNQIINYFTFVYREMLDGIGFHIQNMNKGTIQASSRFPEAVFEVQIDLSGVVHWTGQIKTADLDLDQQVDKFSAYIIEQHDVVLAPTPDQLNYRKEED